MALRVTERTITEWMGLERDPIPVAEAPRRGVASKFDQAAVIAWFVRHEMEKRIGETDGKVYDYEAERARLTHEQADKTALEVEVLRGTLIPCDRVIQEQGAMVTAARSRLLSIPVKAAPMLVNREDKNEIEGYLRDLIHEGLNELKDFDPADYLANQGGDEDVGAAAEDDGKSVGGRKSVPKPRSKRRARKVAD